MMRKMIFGLVVLAIFFSGCTCPCEKKYAECMQKKTCQNLSQLQKIDPQR